MAALIICILFGLIPLIQAFRIKRNPERVYLMQKVKNEQRGSEYEAAMQRYYVFSNLATSVVWMLSGLIGWLTGMGISYIMLALAILLGLITLIAKGRFTGEVYTWQWVLFAIGVVLVVACHLWLWNNSKVEARTLCLYLEGSYEQEMDYQSIDSVLVVDQVPRTKYCMDGHGYLGSKKGEFRLKDGSDAKFYLLSKEAPFLALYTHTGLIFVNRKTSAETEQLIEELSDKIGEKLKN